MKNKGTKQKIKKKGSENAFGCDLTEHLQTSGQDVPQVLKKCAEFIEKHGVVDGIYRLSGVTSNIQRLRQEFCSEAGPDLTKEVYLQDIHCVGSLCKLYFRELPNPLLTYELYGKFTEAVSVQGDHERLVYVQKIIRELPTPHFRTLEYLTKHLSRLATLSTQTNMHTRNLALVWAPNLLRSKNIEASSVNGDMAFQEVRIQQSVVEFILNHTEQIFSGGAVQIKPKEGPSLMCGEKYATLPISGQCGPMKLMSLEEAQARSLGPNHPVHRERQRENSLPDTSAATLYHTVIDVSESKRKFSGKSKKWKSIFNLGRSGDSKGKLSRNGSVFIRAQGMTEKAALRPSRSMESLCSLPTEDDRAGHHGPAGGLGSLFSPDAKSRTLGSDYDLSEHEQNWEFKGIKAAGATVGGWGSDASRKGLPGASAAPQRTLPEQLKVFKGDDLGGYKPTSPKSRRMLYSGSSQSSSSRPTFPGGFFPLEHSPRHQRRAVNISEPFAVSVPLRVSAVISSNSTPCRGHAKEKAAAPRPCREGPEPGGAGGEKSDTFPQAQPRKQEGAEGENTEALTPSGPPEGARIEAMPERHGGTITRELELPLPANAGEGADAAPSPGEEVRQQRPTEALRDQGCLYLGRELWPELHQELKITEPEIDLPDEAFQPVCGARSSSEGARLTADVKSKRSRSSPSLSLLCRELPSGTSLSDCALAPRPSDNVKELAASEADLLFSLRKRLDVFAGGSAEIPQDAPVDKSQPAQVQGSQVASQETFSGKGTTPPRPRDSPATGGLPATAAAGKPQTLELCGGNQRLSWDGVARRSGISEVELMQRLSVCAEERRRTRHLDEDDGGHPEELDLVEPWEDLSATKRWVTSPLHSPDVETLFNQLFPFCSSGGTLNAEEGQSSCPPVDTVHKRPASKSPEGPSGPVPPASGRKQETQWTCSTTTAVAAAVRGNDSGNAAQPHNGRGGAAKQKSATAAAPPPHRFHRQASHEAAMPHKREDKGSAKHRPYSLNLDLGHRCIRDISNQPSRELSSEPPSAQRPPLTSSVSVSNGVPSELEFFLSDRQAPLRRNSAPVSVSSVRTAFMIKTCQARAVPVVPPKVQYSLIPHSRHESDLDALHERQESPKRSAGRQEDAPPPPLAATTSDPREELENKEPSAQPQKQPSVEKSADAAKAAAAEPALVRRRHAPSLEVFVDCPRAGRGNVLQRPSFRNRQRPQSLILLSPPFPIMDYPPAGDDAKLLSGLSEQSAVSFFSREMAESVRAAEGISLQSKMTIPKSGQRLETSTSCFYQPQRRSMIFDSRSQRQIE